MGVKDAAAKVLEEAGEPLNVKELTSRILAARLWQPKGGTPQATVSAQLYSDIKKLGDKSRFVQAGAGRFALRKGRAESSKTTARKRTHKAGGQISFSAAAEKVLEQFGNNRPMHYRDITAKALEHDRIATQDKTPEATMYAQILTSIRKQKDRGEQPRFVQHGQGMVSLSSWIERGLAAQIAEHNQSVCDELQKRLRQREFLDTGRKWQFVPSANHNWQRKVDGTSICVHTPLTIRLKSRLTGHDDFGDSEALLPMRREKAVRAVNG